MSFAVAADAYDRFMGRYSARLAPRFVEFAGVRPGDRVLDVGCGPGAVTAELRRTFDASELAAVDPSERFVATARERHPGADVRHGTAEQLPFGDDEFDAALAQLVVHFMQDPVAGLREMVRVTRTGGVVAACVWDHGGGTGPLEPFWRVVRELDPGAADESERAGTREGHLAELLHESGLDEVTATSLAVAVEHPTFEDWWEPFALGVGPAGAYVAALGDAARTELRERCRASLPAAPFVVSARAWAARGAVP